MNFRILLVVVLMLPATSSLAQFTELYSTDFTAAEGFVDGPLAGQTGWEGQPNWSVSDTAGAGFATGVSNWQRARTFNGLIPPGDMTEGTQVGISATLNLDGTFASTNDFFRIGLGARAEHTGATTPQVYANFAYDGAGNITAGDASVAYTSGDVLELDMIITRGADETTWGLETTLNNVTQAVTSGPFNTTPSDDVGGVNALTLHEYIVAGGIDGDTMLSYRMLNNADAVIVNLDSLTLSIDQVVPSVPGDYDGNGLTDGPDYLLWQQQEGQTGGGLAADGTGDDLLGVPDGDVDEFDLAYWEDNYGAAPSGALGSVPEPSSLVLLLAGLMMANRRGVRS